MSARKYRPSTFGSVVGQDALVQTLKNAVVAGRVGQAYLFCGPRGVGKTSCARIFAKTLNCEHLTPEGEACGECESCRAFDSGRSMNIIELDAASNNSVGDIRNLTEQVNIPPQQGRYRVFIIDEVHMLTTAAFNAFLKTLEEPPRYVVFILATTEKQKVLPTILSRCQVYDFCRISASDAAAHLAHVAVSEGIEADPRALDVIAGKADGAMRDALSIFDQVAASSMGRITYESAVESLNILDYEYYFRLFDAFRAGDVAEALLIYKEIRDRGFDSHFFLTGLAQHLRDLLVAADSRTVGLLEVGREIGARYAEQARLMPASWYHRAIGIVNDADLQYRVASNKQLLVELTLIRLCTGNDGGSDGKKEAAAPDTSGARKQMTSAPASRPAPAPSAAPSAKATPSQTATPSTARPQRRVAVKGARPEALRIHQTPAAASSAAEPTQRHGEGSAGDAPFTAERFAEVLRDFASANGQLHLVVSALTARAPERVDDTTYRILADNPAQLEALQGEMERLTGYLRGRLGNGSVRVLGELAPAEARARVKSRPEMLRDYVSAHPEMGRVLREWDAEMA